MNPCRERRRVLSWIGAAVLAPLAPTPVLADERPSTPRMTEGPFYPVEVPLDHDNDLVRVAGRATPARGEVADVAGRVLDARGRGLAGVRVEIWQCDANGRYHHPGDAREVAQDDDFQGFGVATTDAEGRYRFRTIRPVAYPGRTPHIHFRLGGAGIDRLTTQMFVADDPGNADDRIYNRLEPALRETVTVAFVPVARDDAAWSARFDIVLAADGRHAAI